MALYGTVNHDKRNNKHPQYYHRWVAHIISKFRRFMAARPQTARKAFVAYVGLIFHIYNQQKPKKKHISSSLKEKPMVLSQQTSKITKPMVYRIHPTFGAEQLSHSMRHSRLAPIIQDLQPFRGVPYLIQGPSRLGMLLGCGFHGG